MDPREGLPDEVRAALRRPASSPPGPAGAPPSSGDPGIDWQAEVQRVLEAKGKPWALTCQPMLPTWLAQMEMLRRGGARPEDVADAILRANPASLPATAFQDLRRRLERGRR